MLDLLGVVLVPHAPLADADNFTIAVPSSSFSIATWKDAATSWRTEGSVFLPALITLLAAYPALVPLFPAVRQRVWILTTLASSVMTAFALPGVRDYLTMGGVQGVEPRVWAVGVNRFFQAYLTADMLVGGLCYRSQIGFLTGWVHHVHHVLITETTIRSGWAHLFCLAAVMELPTFILGASTLLPALRSNVVFALTFFATRIAFHLVLLYGLGMTPGLRVPAGILVLVFPMHAMWFHGCVAGFVRRHRQRAASSVNAEGVVVQKAPEVGIDGSDKSGAPEAASARVGRPRRRPLARTPRRGRAAAAAAVVVAALEGFVQVRVFPSASPGPTRLLARV
ncbi:hypothetical protein K438DRAFT_1735644 [Mycena galopus ATCC 62051]|nr:hypothetical protein K438DRAFT_1735644 [Mycena galopus ATCC 62051]